MEVATEQSSIHKAWTYVGKVNVQPTAQRLLFESLQIYVLHGFRGRIGRCRPKSLCTGNGGDGRDVSPTLTGEVPVSLTNHSCKAYRVCLNRSQFYVFFQFPVLMANA